MQTFENLDVLLDAQDEDVGYSWSPQSSNL